MPQSALCDGKSAAECGTVEGRPSALFDSWERIARRVRPAKHIALFLDFDGTLAAYRSRPDEARLSASACQALLKLTGHRHVRIAIVSGRRRAALAHFIKIPRIELMGLYGWEQGKKAAHLRRNTLAKLSEARDLLTTIAREAPDVFVEDKCLSLVVHYRGASPRSREIARARLRDAALHLAPDLHLIRGENSLELVPREVRGKGAAVRALLKRIPKPVLPIYIGDDLTDEPAFSALRSGITIRVGTGRSTAARFGLAHSEEVCVFLARLEAELPRHG